MIAFIYRWQGAAIDWNGTEPILWLTWPALTELAHSYSHQYRKQGKSSAVYDEEERHVLQGGRVSPQSPRASDICL